MSNPARLHYLHLHPGQALPAISAPQPSRIVVVIEASVSPDWQYAVSDWIVAYGCRYMMAWGPDCASWDDSVDWSALEAHDFDIPDDRHVMTTWHDDEPLEEAFFYCEFNACLSSDDVDLHHKLILHIAPEADEERMRSAYAAMMAEAST
jgi:hypothetical protein